MNDLFKLFPPFPSPWRPSVSTRQDEIRASVVRVREKARRNAADLKAVAAKVRSDLARRRSG